MAAVKNNIGKHNKPRSDMKKTFKYSFVLLAMMAGSASAQDIYKVEELSGNDLNGTARFIGMGGAMGSLGADLSVMSTNPAGIGLYRRSDFALTGGVGIQPNAEDFYDIRKARASFDQIGFVYTAKLGDDNVKFVNFGFNYQKRRNLKSYIGVDNFALNGMSQSWQMMDLCYVSNGWLDLSDGSSDRELTTPLALAGYETYMIDEKRDDEGKISGYEPCNSDSYNYQRAKWGGVQQYDFNISLNFQDQVYAGLTVGAYNVDIHGYTDYGEKIINPEDNTLHDYFMTNEEHLTGSGFDLKLGVILRPIETSPFRMGVAIHTPTWYDLKSESYLYMQSPFENAQGRPYSDYGIESGVNEYRIRTPWKFNISMATTVGNYLALDAEYEYSDYSTASISYRDYYDPYYDSWSGHKDRALNQEIKRFMKPVSTFRIGAEARVADGVYLRAGYNYVSAPMKKDAFLNLFTASSSYYYSTNTDYVNLGDINRVTCGLGWRGKHFYADFAYQYQAQKGDLYTFHVPEDGSEQNRLSAAKVDLNRHNLMFTLGYKF